VLQESLPRIANVVFFKEVVVRSLFNIDLYILIVVEVDINFLCAIIFRKIEKQ